jgi:MFS transporter, SET family, sugar efflux transporter
VTGPGPTRTVPARTGLTAPVRQILRDPALRLVTGLIVIFGCFVSISAPYLSLMAVGMFRLGDHGYAAILIAGSLISVAAAIGFGILADQRANRRGIALLCAVLNFIGAGAMVAFPSGPTLALAHALILPAGGAMFGQLFALARLAASRHPADQHDGIMAAIRAAFALPFIIMLPGLSAAIRAGLPVTAVYAIMLLLGLVMLVLVFALWPRDGRTQWADRPSGLPFRAAFREIAHAPVALRVALLGILSCGSTLNWALVGLVFTTTGGRPAADVALFVGLFAGLEVPFMLATPLMLRWLSRTQLVAAGAAIFALHLVLLTPLAPTPFVWALVLPAACGGAIYLSVMVAYVQDLLADRPGAGSSLMAVQKIAGDAIAATAFLIGTALSGYGLTAVLAAAAAIAAAAGLLYIDAPQRQSKKPFGA